MSAEKRDTVSIIPPATKGGERDAIFQALASREGTVTSPKDVHVERDDVTCRIGLAGKDRQQTHSILRGAGFFTRKQI